MFSLERILMVVLLLLDHWALWRKFHAGLLYFFFSRIKVSFLKFLYLFPLHYLEHFQWILGDTCRILVQWYPYCGKQVWVPIEQGIPLQAPFSLSWSWAHASTFITKKWWVVIGVTHLVNSLSKWWVFIRY